MELALKETIETFIDYTVLSNEYYIMWNNILRLF